MQDLNNGFNKFKMHDLIHVNMLIIQEMWKNSLNHSSIIIKYWIICFLVYYNKCKTQFVNNGFNILKVNCSIHVHVLIIEYMWKRSLIHSNINVGFWIFTCVLINYDKCKMQLISNSFNLLKIDGPTHVPCW
jgi:hypothetical protein